MNAGGANVVPKCIGYSEWPSCPCTEVYQACIKSPVPGLVTGLYPGIECKCVVATCHVVVVVFKIDVRCSCAGNGLKKKTILRKGGNAE